MLVDDIKKRVTEAMKAKDVVARDVLRLALGEIQTAEARAEGASIDEGQAAACVRKLIKSNEETLAALGEGDARAEVLRREIAVLGALLPAALSPERLVELLASERDAIRAAKSDGQATGIAMKYLKGTADVDGKNVAAAVKALRS